MANQLPTGFAASQITSPAATADLRRLLREELAEVYERLSAFEERQERLERMLERMARPEPRPGSQPRASGASFSGDKVPAKALIDGFKCLAELHSPRGKKYVPVMITGADSLPDGSLGYMAMRLSGGPKQKWRKVGPKPADAFYYQPKGWKDSDEDDEAE